MRGTYSLCVLLSAMIAVSTVVGQEVRFEISSLPLTANGQLFVTFYKPKLNESVLVYLSNNKTKCDTVPVYAAGWPTVSPAGRIGDVVQWTRHDPDTFFRAAFRYNMGRAASSAEHIYVCYSLNKGRTWRRSADSQGQSFFKLWPAFPSATLQPPNAVATQPLFIHTTHVPTLSRAVLVTNPAGCHGITPSHVYGTNSTLKAGSTTFELVPPKAAARVWLCVAPPPYNHWTIVPIDPRGVATFNEATYPTGEIPFEGYGFIIEPASVLEETATVQCSPIISGVQVTCVLHMSTAIGAPSATDIAITSLTDGAGYEECPLPPVKPHFGTHQFSFIWTPQRFGRGGVARFSFRGNILFVNRSTADSNYHLPENSTEAKLPINRALYRFFVQPEFTFIEQYDYTNFFNLDYFAASSGTWVWADGIPTPFGGRQNGTLDGEMRTATLRPSSSGLGQISQTVDLPPGALNCYAKSHYYFTGDVIDDLASGTIGRFTLTAVDGSSADVGVLADFYLYSYLRRVVVTGAHKADIIDGDVKTMEQLVKHFPVLSNYAKVRMTLQVDRSIARLLYWASPVIKCVTKTPYTNPADSSALKALYNTLGGSTSTLTNWETTQGSGIWNGDPCREHWQGVVCRHFRVVELNLAGRGLAGRIPEGVLHRMSMLEKLDMSRNALLGAVPADLGNNTRLQEVDFSANAFGSFASHNVLHGTRQRCVRKVFLQKNEFKYFPRQVLTLPKLQHLDISKNHLRDSIPDMEHAAAILEHLNVRENELTGALPTLNPKTIRSADFAENKFNGTIPVQWSELLQVQFLDTSSNNLEGEIPDELSKLRTASQVVFRSANNRHNGYVPHLAFQSVDIRGNVFRCPLPFEYSWIVNPIIGLETEFSCDYYDPDAANEL